MEKNTLGGRIELLIKHLGLSQTSFAKSLSTSGTRISNVTQGRNKPDSQLLAAISETYPKVNMGWLLTGKGKLDETVKTSGLENSDVFTGDGLENVPPSVPPNVPPSSKGRKKKGPLPNILADQGTTDGKEWADRLVNNLQKRPGQAASQKTLLDYQNKLNHQLRREDGALWEVKERLEYLGWVFEDARRIMEELEIQYKATFELKGQENEIMPYDLFKALAIRELKRRAKYFEIIKDFAQAVSEFSTEITVDKLNQDWLNAVGVEDGALADAEQVAIERAEREGR